jgi:branched-chain amino acid aminotransferase
MAIKYDWDNLTFAFNETETMYIARCEGEGEWEGGLLPFGDVPVHPSSAVLNYGQGLFEGMKAQYAADGSVVLFRPLENAKRMANGARRLCMPPVPEEMFVEAVKEVVKANIQYVPPIGKGTLYIRPVLWGTGPVLGIAPAGSCTFCVFVCPVGPYFKGGMAPIKLQVTKEFHRAAPHGIGDIKAIGNYSATIYPVKLAKSQGFAENIYLNARDDRSVEEVGAANFFCKIDDELHTPRLGGSILPGITRESLIILAREKLGMKVRERDIDYEEVFTAQEAFCSGTAAVITPIGSVTFGGKEHVINNFEIGKTTKELYDMLTGIQTKKVEDPYEWVVEL